MNLSQNLNTYEFTVYIHTSPNDKKYVGMTCQSLDARWGKHGDGYVNNRHFWDDIQKYGWDNFQHNIIASGLRYLDACRLEEYFISYYKSYDINYGYNMTMGGRRNIPNDLVRSKLSYIQSHRSQEFRDKLSQSLLGHAVSDETKQKISISNKNNPKLRKPRGKMSQQTKDKLSKMMKDRRPWNFGLSKDIDDSCMKISQSKLGVPMKQSTKDKLRDAWIDKFNHGYSVVWVHNDDSEITVESSKLHDYLSNGWMLGRLMKKNRYVHNDIISIKIAEEELSDYISNGWKLGRLPSTNQKLKSSNQRYIWLYDDKEFGSASELALYLNQNGYPNIVSSTITHLYNIGFNKSKIYYNLDGKVRRINK